jgi:hypothetical protein
VTADTTLRKDLGQTEFSGGHIMLAELLEPVAQQDSIRNEQYSQQQGAASPMMVLRELYELLEDYAPMWYSEEAHDRAEAALKQSTFLH